MEAKDFNGGFKRTKYQPFFLKKNRKAQAIPAQFTFGWMNFAMVNCL